MVSNDCPLDLTDRRSLMASLPKGGIGAEIGVAEGCFSEVLLEVCQPRRLYLIDPWIYQADAVCHGDVSNVEQACQEGKYQQVQQRCGKLPNVRIVRDFSLSAVDSFVNDYFDWLHNDANHADVARDIAAWWPKLKSGGWMTGHDYTMVGESITVKQDVDEFVAEHGLTLFVTRGDTDIYEKNYPTWAVQKP